MAASWEIAIDADSQSRVLHMEAGADVTLDSLNMTGGHIHVVRRRYLYR